MPVDEQEKDPQPNEAVTADHRGEEGNCASWKELLFGGGGIVDVQWFSLWNRREGVGWFARRRIAVALSHQYEKHT